MKYVSILGSTGSIGRNTLKVISKMSGRFKVAGLSAGSNLTLFRKQIEIYQPRIVSVKKKKDAEELRNLFNGTGLIITNGPSGTEEVAGYNGNDIVVSAITGISGLRPTLTAIQAGKRVALANKEAMVTAGALLKKAAAASGSEIIPVDSEHSGVFQCIRNENGAGINRVILTASGGPFYKLSPEKIKNQSIESALNHPKWEMGKKISIDSATMMNKGLEIIEARWLFDLNPKQLDVLIHPQSIVHALVEMKDGSILAQLSRTDMKIPIQYALTYPERTASTLPYLDLVKSSPFEFLNADQRKFPLLALAFRALREKPYFSIGLNAANEIAVQEFLSGRIHFSFIWESIIEVMNRMTPQVIDNLDDILNFDREIRDITRNIIKQRK